MSIERSKKVIRIVLDTNVYISALLFGGKPADVILLARDREGIFIYSSPYILEEVRKVLSEKFNWPEDKARELHDLLATRARLVDAQERIFDIQDDADNRVLECAVSSRAHYIVSGDKHLLDLKEFRSISIIKPAEFLALLSDAG